MMEDDKKYLVRARTLKDLDAKLARKRARERRVVAAARKRLGRQD